MLLLYTTMIDSESEQLRFTEIYNNYCKQMMLVAMRVLHNHEDSEEAVQRAFLGIARNIKSVPIHDLQKQRAYVLTAAKNAALSMLPEKKRRENSVDISELPIASNDDLFRQVTLCQDYELLLRSIQKLPSPYREVLFMVYVQEQSVNHTASILHRRSGTVRQQLNRGKRLLIELCREEGLCYEDDI